jgi:hypothetical protein
MRRIDLLRVSWAAAAALALAACASGQSPEPAPSAGAPEAGDLRVGELGPRELSSGECGLFLWSRATPPELVFFANPETGEAAVVLDGRERTLKRLSVETPVPGGRPGSQTFASDSGDVSVRLTVLETEAVQDGYRVASASLRFSDDKGWSGVVPTAGLAACRS